MDTESVLNDRLRSIEEKLDRTYEAVEKTRRYFLWTLLISAVAFILPLAGILIVLPSLLASFSSLSDI
jgi:hypothetical protein